MSHIFIDEYPILTFEFEPFIDKYWNIGLSQYIIEQYGNSTTYDHEKVEKILMSCFEYFISQFKDLILKQDTEIFFKSVFLFHEASIALYIKQLEGFQLPEVIESDFPRYRRVLKLILEQACDIELTAKKGLDYKEIINTIQELYYLGNWIYEFAIYIAYHKMIQNAYYIEFEENVFTCGWQNNFGKVNEALCRYFGIDYETFFDEGALNELKRALEDNFSIDYNKAIGIIPYLKKHHSNNPEQTLEPYILPINLATECKTSEENTSMFYSGLMLSKTNKLTLENAVLKPYSEKRYMFRPILTYIVDGVERALIGNNKIAESMMVIASNMIHWNNMPEEWLKDKGMVDFMNKKGLEHDRLLENEIEKIFQQNKYPYCRNIESFRQKGKKQNININTPKVGEIDFIIENKNKNKVFIADTKYNRARYDAVGYRIDYSNFIEYEKKLERKKNWLINNLQVLQEHLEEMFHIDYSILSFKVEAVFFINTPTFYMFNGKYKALTLLRIKEYIEDTWDYPIIRLEDKTNKRILEYSHPYFKNPIIISTE